MKIGDFETGRVYEGDCRALMRSLPEGSIDVVITDPVWPDTTLDMAGADRPWGLFADASAEFLRLTERVVVQLGCDSDPRFLTGLNGMPYFRTCWLDYACPSPKGRVLFSGDVAYAFGTPPRAGKGRALVPGRCLSGRIDREFAQKGNPKPYKRMNRTQKRTKLHPCPRRLEHVRWLVKWFADGVVLDPFAGSGTTGVACVREGVEFLGFEIEPEYVALANDRISAARKGNTLAEERAGQKGLF